MRERDREIVKLVVLIIEPVQNVEKSDFAFAARILSWKILCLHMENAVDWHKAKCGKVRVRLHISDAYVAPWYDMRVAVENFLRVFHRIGS